MLFLFLLKSTLLDLDFVIMLIATLCSYAISMTANVVHTNNIILFFFYIRRKSLATQSHSLSDKKSNIEQVQPITTAHIKSVSFVMTFDVIFFHCRDNLKTHHALQLPRGGSCEQIGRFPFIIELTIFIVNLSLFHSEQYLKSKNTTHMSQQAQRELAS